MVTRENINGLLRQRKLITNLTIVSAIMLLLSIASVIYFVTIERSSYSWLISLFFIAYFGFSIATMVVAAKSASGNPFLDNHSRNVNLIMVILLGWIGILIYYFKVLKSTEVWAKEDYPELMETDDS